MGLRAGYDRRMGRWFAGRGFRTLIPLLVVGSLSVAWRGAWAEMSPRDVIVSMVAHESEAERHREHYEYVSEERSERTGGHLWREVVAETDAGKVRHLLAVDGQPLTGEKLAAEQARMAEIAAHPEVFARHEQALKNDEQHAREMLNLLPKAYLFENPRQEGSYLRVDFKPNPDYVPQSMEERILHGMVGSVVVETGKMRLRELEGRLPQDVSIAYGLIATIKAGSHFATTRQPVHTGPVYGTEWKTETLETDVTGRAIFFKAIGKQEHAEHSDFKILSPTITVPQAVELVER
jgi:hypothetical protein